MLRFVLLTFRSFVGYAKDKKTLLLAGKGTVMRLDWARSSRPQAVGLVFVNSVFHPCESVAKFLVDFGCAPWVFRVSVFFPF